MKQLVEEVLVNGKNQDAVIEYFMKPLRDENNNPIYTSPKDGIGKCKGSVIGVVIYVKDNDGDSVARVFETSAYAIKKLYAHILEIEQLEKDDFVDLW